MDRLKPAFLEECTAPPRSTDPMPRPEVQSPASADQPPSSMPNRAAPEPQTTRSGRHVRWPARYVDYIDVG